MLTSGEHRTENKSRLQRKSQVVARQLLLCDSEEVKFNEDGSVCAQPFTSMELSQLNKSMEPLPESVLQHMNWGAGVRAPRFLLCPDDGMTLGYGCRSQDPSSLDIKPWTTPPLEHWSTFQLVFKSSDRFYEIIMFLGQSWTHRINHIKSEPNPPNTQINSLSGLWQMFLIFLSHTQRYSCKICFKWVFLFRHLGQSTQFACRMTHGRVAPLAS